MGLRLVSGSAKGRKLKGPQNASIRPAAARVRKSLFDILGNLEGYRILDLFAGTGSMGLEALSRGAHHVTFVDAQRAAISLLRHNLQVTGFSSQATLIGKNAALAIGELKHQKKCFDIIFLDPPYDQGLVDATLRQLTPHELLEADGIVLCEHSPRELPTFLDGLEESRQRKYGQTWVSFLRKSEKP